MKFYFYCHPHGPVNKAAYEHEIVALAEGLKDLGHELYSNVNYWPNLDSSQFLLQHNPDVSYRDCDVVIFGSNIYNYDRQDILPNDLFSTSRAYYLIFIDSSDGFHTPGYLDQMRAVDYVLKCHFNEFRNQPANFKPWQFGITNRMIEAASPAEFSGRRDEVLVNFRVRHQVRLLAERTVMPNVYTYFQKNSEIDLMDLSDPTIQQRDKQYWALTGGRHNLNYYNRLGSSKACAAFGGTLCKDQNFKLGVYERLQRKIDMHLGFDKYYESIWQFDSWRFWESLLAGCITLHVDFLKYGVSLPEMPKNGFHYFGFDLTQKSQFMDLLGDPDLIKFIGENGRAWVLEKYSPNVVAERLLRLISG